MKAKKIKFRQNSNWDKLKSSNRDTKLQDKIKKSSKKKHFVTKPKNPYCDKSHMATNHKTQIALNSTLKL